MNELINEARSGIIYGRFILDSVAAAQKLMSAW